VQRSDEHDGRADQPGLGEQLQHDVVRGGPHGAGDLQGWGEAGGESGTGELSPAHAEPRRSGEQTPRERPEREPRLARHAGEAIERGHAGQRHGDQSGKRQDPGVEREAPPGRPTIAQAEGEQENPEREQDCAARLRVGARQHEQRRRAPPPVAPEEAARDEVEQRGLAKRYILRKQVGLADVADDARPGVGADEAAQEARNSVELEDADHRVR